MTCAQCGMAIDAAAGERLQPVRRARSEPPPDTGDVIEAPARPPGLRWWQTLLVLAVLFGGAAVYVLIPDGDEVRARADERVAEQHRRELADACAQLTTLATQPCTPAPGASDPAPFARSARALLASDHTDEQCLGALTTLRQMRRDAGCR